MFKKSSLLILLPFVVFVLFASSAQAAIYASLSVGVKNAQVRELQQTLTNLGFYNGPITGYFGNLTKVAVIKFQIANGIAPAAGFVGPLTRNKINQLVQGKPVNQQPTPLKPPPTSPTTMTPPPSSSILPPSSTTITPSPTSENPQFAILENDGSLTSADQYGTKIFNFPAIGNLFYKTYSDQYDFLGIYSDFRTTLGGSMLVSNAETGIGTNMQNNSATYGSRGKLKTISALDLFPFPVGLDQNGFQNSLWQDFFALAHEIGHHWCCRVKSAPEIAGQGGHWIVSYGHPHDPALHKQQLDTDGLDIMGGADFIDNRDGTFTMRDYSGISPRVSNFFPFTLYLMGLMSASEVPDTALITFQVPVDTIGTATLGEKEPVHIQNIISLNSSRNPSYPNTQKEFSAGLILVVEKGKQPTKESLTRMQNLVENFPWYWARATHCRSTMSTDLARTNAKKCDPVSVDRSVVTASPSSVNADGTSQSKITILVNDAAGNPLKDRVVQIFPDSIDKSLVQGQMDAIRPSGFIGGVPLGGLNFAVTDSSGKAVFSTTSRVATTFTYFVVIDGSYLSVKPAIKFTSP